MQAVNQGMQRELFGRGNRSILGELHGLQCNFCRAFPLAKHPAPS